tara:strand:- start:671 stop:790 length:120 start_codon:yes stop_codon:yes gene_type:complete
MNSAYITAYKDCSNSGKVIAFEVAAKLTILRIFLDTKFA